MSSIQENVQRILQGLPPDVHLVAAAKTRTPAEIMQAITAGVRIIGENYVQEAAPAYEAIGNLAQWHFIGHLQKNKVKKAVEIFDMIETVDSLELAQEIDKRCRQIGKVMPVLIEVNSGREAQKSGALPEDIVTLAQAVSQLQNVRLTGLMTMGPQVGDQEDFRPYFVTTRKVFEEVRSLGIPDIEMRYLSMGMTNSYRVALEEGANMVRLGTLIFGER
ncbi:MAG: YggS family pyridoxal phosphate-dependent enzyme [Dehalococcoidales bacterium]|nr:YggS family pyridoxal phosphate-dependent enzyme [Dehalococcoidales bacterium]